MVIFYFMTTMTNMSWTSHDYVMVSMEHYVLAKTIHHCRGFAIVVNPVMHDFHKAFQTQAAMITILKINNSNFQNLSNSNEFQRW